MLEEDCKGLDSYSEEGIFRGEEEQGETAFQFSRYFIQGVGVGGAVQSVVLQVRQNSQNLKD